MTDTLEREDFELSAWLRQLALPLACASLEPK